MSKLFMKTAVVIFVAAVLLFSMTTVASAMVGAQMWYLDSEVTTPGYQMEKVGSPGNDDQTGSVDIAAGDCAMWIADQAALVDVTFPDGAWVIEIRTDSDWGDTGNKCQIDIGGWDTATGWYDITTTTGAQVTWDDGKYLLKVELQTDAATVFQGDYLALRICNEDEDDHTVFTNADDGKSCLRSPESDPGYPTPEIVSGILLGLGFLGLAGYGRLRRNKATTES